MENKWVRCHLVDREIEDIDCVENRDAVDDMIAESSVPDEYKRKENWKDICKKCSWHNYGY